MSKTNRILLAAVAVVLLISILTYRQSIGRADRFHRGQLFLLNLNPDEVARISIQKGSEKVTLVREGDRFTIAEKQGYPASNASVNRLLRDLLEISLEREIGVGAHLAEELEIDPPSDTTIQVGLQDATAKEMVSFRVGRAFDDGPGHYVRRMDDEDASIYLSSGGITISSSPGSFLEKQIVDHDGSQVLRIEGVDFLLERNEAGTGLELADTTGETETSKISGLRSLLRGLRFDEVFVADDPLVADLAFEQVLRIDLEDGSGYVLSYAGAEERHFMRIQGYNTLQQVAITMDESEADLQEKADKLTRADEIDDFNDFHGSWVYEIGDFTADKLQLRRVGLLATS